jgi:hypothetical protein
MSEIVFIGSVISIPKAVRINTFAIVRSIAILDADFDISFMFLSYNINAFSTKLMMLQLALSETIVIEEYL